MSRIIGRVENPRFLSDPLYFVHCSSSGYSFPALFADVDEMWRTWEKGEDFHDLDAAVPATSKLVMVAKITFAYGKRFDPSGETFGEPTFGLVTAERLISTSRFEDRDLVLLDVRGTTHIAEEVDGGFDGQYYEPLCAQWHKPSSADRLIELQEVFDHPLDLCPSCVAKVTQF